MASNKIADFTKNAISLNAVLFFFDSVLHQLTQCSLQDICPNKRVFFKKRFSVMEVHVE